MFFRVFLTHTGDKKINTIKVVRELSGLGLAEAKELVEKVPSQVAGGLTQEDATVVCDVLIQLGNGAYFEYDSYDATENTVLRNINLYEYAGLIQKAEDAALKVEQKKEPSAYGNDLGNGIKRVAKRWAIGIGIILFLEAVFVIAFSWSKKMESNKPVSNSQTTTVIQQKISSKEVKTETKKILETIEDSPVWKCFAREAFGKELKKLKSEDFEKVVYIDFNAGEDYAIPFFTFQLADGTKGTFQAPEEALPLEIFNLFPNLEYLDSNYIRYSGKDAVLCIEKLKHLGFKYTSIREELDENKIAGLWDLTSLRMEVDYDTTILSTMSNLEALELKLDTNMDLQPLADMPNLKVLKIDYESTEFKVADIMPLTGLQSLYIKGKRIKDIRFIENLPNLTSFGLEETNVIRLDSIEKIKDRLTELYLIDNYEARGYHFVSEMSGLKKLALSGYVDKDGWDANLSKLTELEELDLGGVHDVSSLNYLTKLKKLSFNYNYFNDDMAFLAELPELTELHLHNGSLYRGEIHEIAKCGKLENLCLYDTFVWDDISGVLNMPSLRFLDMRNATCGLMADWVQENTALEYWNLEDVRIHDLDAQGKWYNDNPKIDLSEVAQVFHQMKGLKSLYLPRGEMETLDFLSDCGNLNVLDVSGNYIVDLTPVKKLPLVYIKCDSNQIYEFAGMENIVNKD